MNKLLSYTKAAEQPLLLEDTIGHYFDSIVDRYPDHEALVVRHQFRNGRPVRLTYFELQNRVDECAKALLVLGVERGDRVGIWAPNCEEWCVVHLATAKIGAILVSFNPVCQRPELAYMLRQSRCNVLIAAEGFMGNNFNDILSRLLPELTNDSPILQSLEFPELQYVITLGGAYFQGMILWPELLAMAGKATDDELCQRGKKLNNLDPINIQYTSGTTGQSKGATLSHRNILNNAFFCTRNLGFTANDRLVIPVSMHHCFGMVLGSLGCISHGATMIYSGEFFSPLAVLKAVHEERASALYGVPSMFIAELDHPRFDEFDLTCLRTGIMAGAPCPPDLMTAVIEKMHMGEIQIACGMTETSPVSLQTSSEDPLEKRIYSVGRTQPHQETMIAGMDGKPVGRGEVGELCTRGYSLMLGYWDDPSGTADVIDGDGWIHSGDLAVMDDKGYVSIVGRCKDMIIRGGENIYPREIEDLLHDHPGILDVQVTGVSSERYGEEVVAWVIVKNGITLSDQDVKKYCKGMISDYKIPRYVKLIEQFPLTSTGKVQKFKLREMLEKESDSR